ncbi:unnamed protein product [Paramecium pentaurelia]|uniref:Uncharacterized protein n=1 Tax=Paramecium pentaurelia TaxID=43138 RepID=A0A8S1YQP8_9CILI|nr:unnamed protein product [Paramecium pentaurelia]
MEQALAQLENQNSVKQSPMEFYDVNEVKFSDQEYIFCKQSVLRKSYDSYSFIVLKFLHSWDFTRRHNELALISPSLFCSGYLIYDHVGDSQLINRQSSIRDNQRTFRPSVFVHKQPMGTPFQYHDHHQQPNFIQISLREKYIYVQIRNINKEQIIWVDSMFATVGSESMAQNSLQTYGEKQENIVFFDFISCELKQLQLKSIRS